MHTVFLYVCTFIIWSFVHSGRIVADREMFDISAILHFCVSNKKKTFWCTMTFAVQRKNHVLWVRGAAGRGQGGRGRPHVQNKLYSQVTRPTSRRAEAASVNHACSAPLPQVQIETGSTWTWPYQDLHQNCVHSPTVIRKSRMRRRPWCPGMNAHTHACRKLALTLTLINKPPTGFLKDPGNPSVQPRFKSNYLYEVFL